MDYSNFSGYSRNKLFLLANLLFWLAHWFVWLFIDPIFFSSYNSFITHVIEYIIPFLSAYGIRFVLKKYSVHRWALVYIVFIVIALSILCGIFWLAEQQVLVYLFWNLQHFQGFDYVFFRALWYQSYPFLVWSAIYIGFKISEEFNIQKQQTEKAASLAQKAQLEMLRYQLNPHFLFNTLSSLRALIRNKETEIAEGVVTKISEFLKYSLLEGEESKVLLSKEIKTIHNYFEIEKVRFKDQLMVNYNIDPLSENYMIPVFLIHPLIENAVKHGMKTSPSPLQISVYTKYKNDTLNIDIINSGKWIEYSLSNDSDKTGIANTIKRLELAYPDQHTFQIEKGEQAVQISISIKMETE